MRRSIAYVEPGAAIAGERGSWKFIYTPSTNLPKGTKCKFDLLSKGRDIEWEIPQTDLKKKSNVIWMEMPGGKSISASAITPKGAYAPYFEFTLPQDVKSGESIAIFMGTPTDDMTKKGTLCQQYVYRRRPFHLYIDPKGKGNYKEPEIFNLDVRGGPLHSLSVISPSVVSKNQRFDIIVRFEDRFGNLTSNAPEGNLIELSYEQLRDSLNWKLFVPETGFIALPNLYFNESGLYRFKLVNTDSKEKFLSAPIKCFDSDTSGLFWGTFHGESTRVDAAENIESALRHFRDDQAMQFFSTSCFDSDSETSNAIWKLISNQIAEFNEEDRFATYAGFQWQGAPGSEGLRQIIHLKDNKPLLRSKDAKSNHLKKIYKSYTTKDLISIPTFTMAKGYHFDFKEHDPEHEPVVEIYNSWGSSECTAKEGNPRPIKAKGRKGISEEPAGSIRAALNQGHRFGFVAGGLDDRGIYSDLYRAEQEQYSPGMTAILAPAHTRDSLSQSLIKKSCYATTGARIILVFNIAGKNMGSELNTTDKPGLLFNRHITGSIAGTAPIQEIALIRNGEVFHTYHPHETSFDFQLDDTEPLENIVISGPSDYPSFAYYYLRIIQEDGHIAWASPIWIDLDNASAKKPKKK